MSWRPKLLFDWTSFKELLGFGSNVLSNNVAIYAMTNIDIAIIGRTLGEVALGIYSLALNIVKMPVYRFSAIISKVAFPTFSAVQDDLPKFRAGYTKSLKFISVFTFPLLAGLALLAPEIVSTFFGEKWYPMVVPLQILCPMGLLKSIGTTKGAVLLARGKADIEFRWNLVFIIPLGAGIYWASQFGLVGVTLAYTIIYIIGFPIIQGITNRVIELDWHSYFNSLYPAFFATLLMTILILGFRLSYHYLNIAPILFLSISLLFGAAVYIGFLYIVYKEIFYELRGLIFGEVIRND